MTPLTWVTGGFRAEVLAARLRSEGIDAQLQGALSGAYGFTVGDMARVDVYVPEDQLDDAKYVLLADEVDATLTAPTDWWDAGTDRPPRRRPLDGCGSPSCSLRCVGGAGLVGVRFHHW